MTEQVWPGADWTLAQPQDLGFEPAKLAAALAFMQGAEIAWPRDLAAGLNADPTTYEPPPWNKVLGPTKPRGGPNGVVIRGGQVAGAYGDTLQVDMTFSVAKSYLAVLTGIAVRDELIRSIDEPVRSYALDDGFDEPQNQTITWRHFLHQTSEWEGKLFSKADRIDRHRQVGPGADNSQKGRHRDLRRPGSFFEYNDVRVNRFSLSLMQVFKRPLPEVLKTEVMEPIGASDTWRWHGYHNSTVTIDGQAMVSVPGGSHWGGGIFIHTEDHARFALMVARDGCWNGQRILPSGWVQTLRTPSPLNPGYGALWWLNTGQAFQSNAPASSFFAVGAGGHYLWLEPSLDLTVIMRWMDTTHLNTAIGMIMDALK